MIKWLKENEKPVKKFSIERSYFGAPLSIECYGNDAIVYEGGKGIVVYFNGDLVAAYSSYDSVAVLDVDEDDKQDTN